MTTKIHENDEVILSRFVKEAHMFLLKEFSATEIAEFKNMKEEDLISLHNGFGTELRNSLNLWELHSNQTIETHPDEMSMRAIEELHLMFNNPPEVQILVTNIRCKKCNSPVLFCTYDFRSPSSTGYCANPRCEHHKEVPTEMKGGTYTVPFERL